jgi:hypothetical protein
MRRERIGTARRRAFGRLKRDNSKTGTGIAETRRLATGEADVTGPTTVDRVVSSKRPYWREALAPYEGPQVSRSALDVATSVVPYLALFVLMVLALDVSYLLTLALAIPASGFLVRTYIVFHDCTHGSFLPTKRANAWLGASLGLLLFTTFAAWRRARGWATACTAIRSSCSASGRSSG